MKPGSVIIDVAIDQGGYSTSRPTSHAEPTFVVDNVVHYCVTNKAVAVGRTSTHALCNATHPMFLHLPTKVSWIQRTSRAIQTAVNIFDGQLIQPAVAKSFNLPCSPNPFSK